MQKIEKKWIGNIRGEDVYAFLVTNGKGTLSAEILTYGGILRSLWYKGTDVALGRETLEDYFDNDGYIGPIIGRHAGRIQDAFFTLNGKTYILPKTENERVNLHSGDGFHTRVWQAEEVSGEEAAIKLSMVSPDGDGGFPGEVTVSVTFTVTNDDALRISYCAHTDADTLVNLTSHGYFNLNGHDSGSIENHTIVMNAAYYLPNNTLCAPTGEIRSVEGTSFDMRQEKRIGALLHADFPETNRFGGFDHTMVLQGTGFRKIAEVTGDKTGITMECITDRPGVHFYTGNKIDPLATYKHRTVYSTYQGFCLETQLFPDSMKYPFFPSVILKSGETFQSKTEYRFMLKKEKGK